MNGFGARPTNTLRFVSGGRAEVSTHDDILTSQT